MDSTNLLIHKHSLTRLSGVPVRDSYHPGDPPSTSTSSARNERFASHIRESYFSQHRPTADPGHPGTWRFDVGGKLAVLDYEIFLTKKQANLSDMTGPVLHNAECDNCFQVCLCYLVYLCFSYLSCRTFVFILFVTSIQFSVEAPLANCF